MWWTVHDWEVLESLKKIEEKVIVFEHSLKLIKLVTCIAGLSPHVLDIEWPREARATRYLE